MKPWSRNSRGFFYDWLSKIEQKVGEVIWEAWNLFDISICGLCFLPAACDSVSSFSVMSAASQLLQFLLISDFFFWFVWILSYRGLEPFGCGIYSVWHPGTITGREWVVWWSCVVCAVLCRNLRYPRGYLTLCILVTEPCPQVPRGHMNQLPGQLKALLEGVVKRRTR